MSHQECPSVFRACVTLPLTEARQVPDCTVSFAPCEDDGSASAQEEEVVVVLSQVTENREENEKSRDN